MLIGDLKYFDNIKQRDLDIDAFEKAVIIDGPFEEIAEKFGLKIHERHDDQDDFIFSNGVLISKEIINKFEISGRFSLVHYNRSNPDSIYICIPVPKKNKFQQDGYIDRDGDSRNLNSIVSGLVVGVILNFFNERNIELIWESEILLNTVLFSSCIEIAKSMNIEIKKDKPKSEPGMGR